MIKDIFTTVVAALLLVANLVIHLIGVERLSPAAWILPLLAGALMLVGPSFEWIRERKRSQNAVVRAPDRK